MKRAGKILLCLASLLACHVIARAGAAALPNNPYALVVTRNVFNLNPPAPPAPPAPAAPPPKITPNGILSILGHYQVLFKAPVVKPGQPATDQSYNLSEGQSQDDIEVTRIDEKNGIVTFNNHGTVQALPLIATSASSGAALPSAPAGGINVPGRIPPPSAMANGDNGFNRFGANGAIGRQNPNLGNGGNNPGVNYGAGRGNSGQQSEEALSPEAQVIMMEANRVATQDLIDQGKMPPLPPTPLTPSDAKGNYGQPLIQLPPLPGQ